MTGHWLTRMLEQEMDALRDELRSTIAQRDEAIDERDRARETATRLEQELNNPLAYIQVWR